MGIGMLQDFSFLKFLTLSMLSDKSSLLISFSEENSQHMEVMLFRCRSCRQILEDPMARIFPKVTKCTFHKYGPSGTVQTLDGLCILPLNIINEKIYVFLWFWFIFLAVVSSIHFVYRLIVIFIPQLRETLLKTRARTVPAYEISNICSKTSRGDWFILYQLGKNIDPIIFKEFLNKLNGKMVEDNNGYM